MTGRRERAPDRVEIPARGIPNIRRRLPAHLRGPADQNHQHESTEEKC